MTRQQVTVLLFQPPQVEKQQEIRPPVRIIFGATPTGQTTGISPCGIPSIELRENPSCREGINRTLPRSGHKRAGSLSF